MTNLLRYNFLLCGFVLNCTVAHSQPLQDPTKPKTIVSSSLQGEQTSNENGTLVLQSVFIKQSGYLAVISGQIVKEGDALRGYVVNQITEQSVTLKQDQETKILRLYQHAIKK